MCMCLEFSSGEEAAWSLPQEKWGKYQCATKIIDDTCIKILNNLEDKHFCTCWKVSWVGIDKLSIYNILSKHFYSDNVNASPSILTLWNKKLTIAKLLLHCLSVMILVALKKSACESDWGMLMKQNRMEFVMYYIP